MTQYDILIFSAHPDDAEFAIGGTMLKLVRAGKKVLNVIFTKGQKGTHGTPEERVEEMQSASKFGGYDYRFLDFVDCEIEYNHSSVLTACQIIRESKPDIVLAPYHTSNFGALDGASHIDHLAVGKITKDAAKLSRLQKVLPNSEKHQITELMYYMVPKNLVPSFVIDISDVVEELKKLHQCFKTQMRITRGDNKVADGLLSFRKSAGYLKFFSYAEAFYSDDPIGFTSINISPFNKP